MNIATITRELYDVDREDRIAQISERKRRTYKFVYHAVNMINTIVLFAINYLIMWIVWYIIMDPPFGKARYIFPFEDTHNLLICSIPIIVLCLCTRRLLAKEYPHICLLYTSPITENSAECRRSISDICVCIM